MKSYARLAKTAEVNAASVSSYDRASAARFSKEAVKWKEKAQKAQKELAAMGLPYKLSQLGHIPENMAGSGIGKPGGQNREWARNLARAQGYVK